MDHKLNALLGRSQSYFYQDIVENERQLSEMVANSTFLIIGAAGSIGQALVKEVFYRKPLKIHLIDISENNLVELVRDLRSSVGYINGEFKTFAIDMGTPIFDAFMQQQASYDYVINLSALKHVRSEKDPFTLMRMIDVNVINTIKSVQLAASKKAKKYFCVSTDKATDPVNMMGASKRLMEHCIFDDRLSIAISTARFANVAYSDGSLLNGFEYRMQKGQPIVAPSDIKRYFLSKKEAGELCLLSILLGEHKAIFIPKLSDTMALISLSDIAIAHIEQQGYTPVLCDSEEQARSLSTTLPLEKKWPCLLTPSTTTGEKKEECFSSNDDNVDYSKFHTVGVASYHKSGSAVDVDKLIKGVNSLKQQGQWTRADLIALFNALLPDFNHQEAKQFLDEKM